jgi:predicted transcriptional regulator with HTH domain
MSNDREVLEGLLAPSTLKILKLFINNEDQRYYLREIAKLTKVPPASTYRIIQDLVKLELLEVEHIKKFKLYRFNASHGSFLTNVLQDRKSAVVEFVNSIKEFDGIEMVVLHGQEDKNKANVLVIGNNMDIESIKRNSVYIADKYKFNIVLLTLVPEQYNQMASMGLYPGKKKILYEAE